VGLELHPNNINRKDGLIFWVGHGNLSLAPLEKVGSNLSSSGAPTSFPFPHAVTAVPVPQLCSTVGHPAKYSSLLGSDSFLHSSSLHLFFVHFTSTFLCHFHLYCHFVSPLPFILLFTFTLHFFFPPFLHFLPFNIHSFSVLTLLFRHFCSRTSFTSVYYRQTTSPLQISVLLNCSLFYLLPLLVFFLGPLGLLALLTVILPCRMLHYNTYLTSFVLCCYLLPFVVLIVTHLFFILVF